MRCFGGYIFEKDKSNYIIYINYNLHVNKININKLNSSLVEEMKHDG